VAAYFVYIWAMYAPDFLVGRRKAALPRPFIQVSPTPSPSGQGVYFDEALGEWIKVAPDAQSGKEHSMRPSWLLLMGSSADWAMNLQVVLIVHPAAPLAIFWIALISVAAPLLLAAATSVKLRRPRHMWLFVLGCERWSDAGNKLSDRAEVLLSAAVLAARCVPSLYAQAAFLSVQATMPPSANQSEPTLDTAIVGLALALSLAVTARRIGALFSGMAGRHHVVSAAGIAQFPKVREGDAVGKRVHIFRLSVSRVSADCCAALGSLTKATCGIHSYLTLHGHRNPRPSPPAHHRPPPRAPNQPPPRRAWDPLPPPRHRAKSF